tara:strand:+ start:294 stop:695 length:402 start_codon:yes stop_codon:yes gene_type:complete
MPRKRQNVGLEHGGDYGTVQATADSMNPNKGGIPLGKGEVAPDLSGFETTAPTRSGPPQTTAVSQMPLPIEAAQAFTPKVTPLDSPGSTWGQQPPTVSRGITPKQEAAMMVASWADATGDPLLAEAAAQLSNG